MKEAEQQPAKQPEIEESKEGEAAATRTQPAADNAA